MSRPELLRAALEHHQNGQLDQAETLYRQILQVEPNHPDALHFLGILAQQAGQFQIAFGLIGRSIKANPANPVFYANLGQAFWEIGELHEAEVSFQKALSLNSDCAEAHNGLGLIRKREGNLEEACICYQEAVSFQPGYVKAYVNLGIVFQEQGKLEEAEAAYNKAISLEPNSASAHNNLGAVLKLQGKLDEAVSRFRKALSLASQRADVHSNLGSALSQQRNFDEAIDCYRKALSLEPDRADFHNNLGGVLQLQGKPKEAIACYDKAISLKPDFAPAYNNLGSVLEEQGRTKEAAAAFLNALSVDPHFTKACSNLIFLHAYAHDAPMDVQCALARRWELIALTDQERLTARTRNLTPLPRRGRRLKIGVLSAELGQHAVAEFLEPLLWQFDHSRVHITLYSTAFHSDPRASRIREAADEYRSFVGISDSAAAEQIRSDEIDVLVETTSHTSGGRLGILAHRAAPVQCHYIGHCGTSGLTEMDWFIADDTLLPSACDSHFCEHIWRLPRLWISYRGDPTLPESRWQPDAHGTIWLGSFNKISKVREDTCRLWAKALNAIPESKLLLKDCIAGEDSVRHDLLAEFSRHGIAEERFQLTGWTPDWRSHMALYDQLDIALDPIPFNSGTTAFDALWMGVPLVALEGDWMGGRISSTILKSLGKTEWVAQTEDDYVAKVRALASDVEGRRSMRTAQRALMAASPLCDARELARAFEDAFEAMFDRWAEKERSMSDAVERD
jgi:predicted O-linked N-acetylglucosamine transferase (SPINDLY family)